jgi:hypothetical protein
MMMKRPGIAWPFSYQATGIARLLSGRFAAPGSVLGYYHEEKAT